MSKKARVEEKRAEPSRVTSNVDLVGCVLAFLDPRETFCAARTNRSFNAALKRIPEARWQSIFTTFKAQQLRQAAIDDYEETKANVDKNRELGLAFLFLRDVGDIKVMRPITCLACDRIKDFVFSTEYIFDTPPLEKCVLCAAKQQWADREEQAKTVGWRVSVARVLSSKN